MQTANITNNDSLNVRLNANRNFGTLDFHAWVFHNCAFESGMDVLDVGCGNGKQVLEALRVLGSTGSVTALDISQDSVQQLRAATATASNLELVVADMREVGRLIVDTFRVKSYDLAQATYALFYGVEHVKILEAMRKSLKPQGRLLVTTPLGPNGLRQLVNRLGFPTPELAQIDNFGSNVLEPYFRSFFDQVDIQIRRNLLRLPSVEAVRELYRSTAYHFEEAEPALLRFVAAEIEARGFFAFEKNAYMIQGSNPSSV
ncbi:class I SAM-dependent methyltransferase [bacterium]|nr:class I SAM-dependent methyltransferase [bacterium]